jgi:glutathione S-transferase
MLTFYFTPGASSMAAHIAVQEVGVPFESRPLSLTKGEQHAPAYRALNPEGKVPTLVIDGRPLTEVAAILYYLAKQFPAAGLLPPGVEAEAHAISWMSFIASTHDAASGRSPDDRDRKRAGLRVARLPNVMIRSEEPAVGAHQV